MTRTLQSVIYLTRERAHSPTSLDVSVRETPVRLLIRHGYLFRRLGQESGIDLAGGGSRRDGKRDDISMACVVQAPCATGLQRAAPQHTRMK